LKNEEDKKYFQLGCRMMQHPHFQKKVNLHHGAHGPLFGKEEKEEAASSLSKT
jgi:hypothetical protein